MRITLIGMELHRAMSWSNNCWMVSRCFLVLCMGTFDHFLHMVSFHWIFSLLHKKETLALHHLISPPPSSCACSLVRIILKHRIPFYFYKSSLLHSFGSSEIESLVLEVAFIEAAFEACPQIITQLCAITTGSAELQDVAFEYTSLYGNKLKIRQGKTENISIMNY